MQVDIFTSEVEFEGEQYKSILPKVGTSEAAGVDVSTPYPFKLEPGAQHLVDSGLIIKCPRGYCIQVLPRSGLACKKGVVIPNSPGLIDRDYSGPNDKIKVMLKNTSDKAVEFEQGDRVAQLLFVSYKTPDWKVQDNAAFAKNGSRGGFGSTGYSVI